MARAADSIRVVALDEFDQETAALVREHMRLPGMNLSTANRYRDKLAMRTSARQNGFLVPEFCGVFSTTIFVPIWSGTGPWLLKPRRRLRHWGFAK